MSIYYAIVKGDPLTSGGNSQVIGGNPRCTIEGPDGQEREQAYLGHQAWCATCQSVGVIVAGAGISDYLRGWDETMGAQEAVSDDIVICKCERHPRVMAAYARSWEYIDTGRASSVATLSATSMVETNNCYDQRFRLVNPRTGQPLRDTPYHIATDDGDELDGYTDAQGYTQPITGTQAISATLHVLEEVTPINPDWDKGL